MDTYHRDRQAEDETVYDRDQHAKHEADALNGGEGRRDARNRAPHREAIVLDEVIVEETIIEASGTVPGEMADQGMTGDEAARPVGAGPEAGRAARARGPKDGWNRREWAGETPAEPSEDQWNKNEWAGEPPDASVEEGPGEMPPGEAGPQGLGHNPGEQHWAGDRRS